MSVNFNINTPAGDAAQCVELSSHFSEMANQYLLVGRFANVIQKQGAAPTYENWQQCQQITVDGHNTPIGSMEEVAAVIARIQEAIDDNTGTAAIMGKDLVITTKAPVANPTT